VIDAQWIAELLSYGLLRPRGLCRTQLLLVRGHCQKICDTLHQLTGNGFSSR
jgi:hypothetical protein